MKKNPQFIYLKKNLITNFLLLFTLSITSVALAQVSKLNDQPILISLESYLVQERENEAGQKQEWFEKVNKANVDATIEIRLNVKNKAEDPLAAATLLVTMPIPENMEYIKNSATPNSALVMLEFSTDKTIFAENLFETVTSEDSEESPKRRPVSVEDYQAIRWTVLNEFAPDEELILYYRVKILDTPEDTTNQQE